MIYYDKKVTGITAPLRARRSAKNGDTIISTVRPYLKAFAFVNQTRQNTLFSTGFAVLRPNEKKEVLPKIIYYSFMYSKELMKQMGGAMPKGSYPSINLTDIENFTIRTPSLLLQQQLVKEIEILEAQIATAQNVIDNAPLKKQEILKKWLE